MALDYKSSLGRYRRYLQMVQTQPLWSASAWVIMSLLLMIILTWMALRPTLITISGLFGQIKQQRELSAKLDNKILTVRKAIHEMEDVKGDLPLLEKMIPSTPEWEILTGEIYQIATASGMSITLISVDKIPTSISEVLENKQYTTIIPTGLIPMKFSITGMGSYEQIMEVLIGLEKSPRMILLSSVSVDEDKTGQLNLNVSGEVGFMPESKTL